MAPGRTPLMAGNWKMNLDHLQATHLVQKLDWTLKDGKHDFGAVEFLPRLVDGDGTEVDAEVVIGVEIDFQIRAGVPAPDHHL